MLKLERERETRYFFKAEKNKDPGNDRGWEKLINVKELTSNDDQFDWGEYLYDETTSTTTSTTPQLTSPTTTTKKPTPKLSSPTTTTTGGGGGIESPCGETCCLKEDAKIPGFDCMAGNGGRTAAYCADTGPEQRQNCRWFGPLVFNEEGDNCLSTGYTCGYLGYECCGYCHSKKKFCMQ